MSAPTKGPFTVHPQSHGCEVRGPLGIGVGWFGCSVTAGRDGSYSISADEAEANARLFVAAHYMLETLESIAALAANGQPGPALSEIEAKAQVAIRKAKGEA